MDFRYRLSAVASSGMFVFLKIDYVKFIFVVAVMVALVVYSYLRVVFSVLVL